MTPNLKHKKPRVSTRKKELHTVVKFFQEERLRQELTQNDLADKSGVPVYTLTRLENGTSRLNSFIILNRLLCALGYRLSIAKLPPTNQPKIEEDS